MMYFAARRAGYQAATMAMDGSHMEQVIFKKYGY
jgi:hypothetical protein